MGSKVKAFAMACLGFILSFIGVDVLTGVQRFIFGHMELADGLGLVPVLMGVFGISEILVNLEGGLDREIYETKIKGLLPNREDWSNSIIPILRALQSVALRAFCRAEGRLLRASQPTPSRKRFRNTRKNSGRASLKEWPHRSRRIIPPRPRGSFPYSSSGSPRTEPWLCFSGP